MLYRMQKLSTVQLVVDELMRQSIMFGEEALLGVLEGSPSEPLLMHLVVALRQTLGLETRAAVEVEEVARDIRERMEKMKNKRTIHRKGAKNAKNA